MKNMHFETIFRICGDKWLKYEFIYWKWYNQILDIIEHPNQKKYKNQKIYVVFAKEYVFLVPFITDSKGDIFLKTIIPSRKAKQKYIKEHYEKE